MWYFFHFDESYNKKKRKKKKKKLNISKDVILKNIIIKKSFNIFYLIYLRIFI